MILPATIITELRTAGLDVDAVQQVVAGALAEDLAGGVDITSVATVPFDQESVVDFVARAPGVVAGLPVVAVVLSAVSDSVVQVETRVADGARVDAGTVLLTATGRTRALLTAERTALNLLCHLSGIATLTRAWVDAIAGSGAAIRDTRKTTPGLRALEKYAVRCGGGVNHRFSLADAALIKDNHVAAAGGVGPAYRAVRAAFPDVPVEVECDTVDQVREAVEAGAGLVLLDNMPVESIRASVEVVRASGRRCKLEASGGISLATAAAVAATGVDFLSIGALTHSAPVLDIGADLRALL